MVPVRAGGLGRIGIQQGRAALAFSSDWNVAEMDPLTGIYTALTRQGLSGGDPFVPEQANWAIWAARTAERRARNGA